MKVFGIGLSSLLTSNSSEFIKKYALLAYSLKVVTTESTLEPMDLDEFSQLRVSTTDKTKKLVDNDITNSIGSKLAMRDPIESL